MLLQDEAHQLERFFTEIAQVLVVPLSMYGCGCRIVVEMKFPFVAFELLYVRITFLPRFKRSTVTTLHDWLTSRNIGNTLNVKLMGPSVFPVTTSKLGNAFSQILAQVLRMD